MKLRKLEINTATLIGSIYKNAIHGKTNLEKIDKEIVRDAIIIDSQYFPNVRDRKKKPDFSHSCAIVVCCNGHNIKVKLCNNGALQVTGIKSVAEKEFLESILQASLSKINKKCNVLEYAPDVKFNRSPMVTASTFIIDPRIKCMNIDNDKLVACLNREGIATTYRKKGADIELSIDDISYSIYSSGKIKILYSDISLAEQVLFSHINNLLNKYILEIQMTDTIQISIDNIKETSSIKQGSPEWFKMRLGLITATRIGLCAGFNSFGHSATSLIKVLANEYKGIPENFISNCYCRKGTRYEPVVRKVFLFHKSHFCPENKFAIFESGLILHKTHKFIGASPDGFIFIFDPRIPLVPKTLDDLQKAHAAGLILDTMLIEIKCPWKVKSPYESSSHTIKCVNGYVPDNYWAQMQQQMAVTNINVVNFVSNNVQEYIDESVFIKALSESPNYKGIVLSYSTLERKNGVCPEDTNCLGCHECTEFREHTIYPGDMDDPSSYNGILCSNLQKMAEIKGILEARFQSETKGIKTAYKKFVYWYMATLPEVVIVKYDEKWYRETAIVAAIKVVEAAKLMNKLCPRN